jgi:hypothetical protein
MYIRTRSVRPLVEPLEGRTFLSAGFEAAPVATPAAVASAEVPVAPLGGVLQYQTEETLDHAFVDLVKASSGFRNLSGGLATVDANGWPTQDFTVPLWKYSTVAVGRYNVLFSGPAGTTVSPFPAPTSSTQVVPKITKVGYDAATGVHTYAVDVPANLSNLSLKFANTGGQVKNLRVLQPGYALSTTQAFTTRYVNFLKSFAPDTLRTMELTATNQNTTSLWSQRPKPGDATYTRAGVPWEHVVQLCNDLKSNIWVCVPAHATDDYVRQLATLLRDKLAPDLTVYVEYSNEVWNQGFEQGKYNLAQAKAEVAAGGSNLNYDGSTDPYLWADRRTARRLGQISDLFKAAWADAGLPSPINNRVRCSLGNQAAMPSRVDPMLEYLADVYGPPADRLWSVGVAIYYSMGKYQDRFVDGKWVTNNDHLTVDQVIEGMDLSVSAYENQQKFAQQLTHAAAYGLRLDAYELGLDTKGPFNIQAKRSANLDPRVRPLIERFVDAFHDQGGDLANWYTLGARSFSTSFGTWSITESLSTLNQPKEQAFRALRGLPPTVSPPGSTPPPTLAAASDTGQSATDGVTADNTPTLLPPALPAGTSYRVLMNGASVTATPVPAGTAFTSRSLADGTYTFTVVPIDAAGNAAAAGGPLTVTVDTAGPAPAFEAVAPDPRLDPVAAVGLAFPETVYGLTAADLSLTLDGGPNLLAADQPLTATGGRTFALSGLASLTAGVGTYALSLRAANGATDLAGNPAVPGATETWAVAGPPTADAGGPYVANEGTTATLSAAGSSGAGLSYAWDLDYDGITFEADAAGVAPGVPVGDGPAAARTVAVRVTDAAGRTAVATTTLAVTNVAPTAAFSAGPAVAVGAASKFTFSAAADPSAADVAAGLRYSFDFNNDGDFADPGDVADSTTPTASYAFAAAGTYPVRGRVADKDSGFTDYAVSAVVTTPTPTTVSLRSPADAHVRDGTYAGTNFGTAAALEVRKSSIAGQQREAYLRFDLTTVPSAGRITSAVVRLYGKLSAAGSVPVGLYPVASGTWTEGGVKWSAKPAAGATALGTKTVASTTAAWVEYDVTAYLKQQKAAGATTFNLALKATAYTTPWASFNSDEAAANRPALVVIA